MGVTAIVGANWGDEGKGKVTDVLAGKAKYVVRYQGGSNAGHTIINEYGKFALRLLPSGVFHSGVINVIGPGVALDMSAFIREREALIARGVPEPIIQISDRAQVVMPYHKLFDELEEERLGARAFGSTKTGIAPFYADKYLKLGIQVADLFDVDRLTSRLEASLEAKNILLQHLYRQAPIEVSSLLPQLLQDAEQIKPFVCNTTLILHAALGRDETILVEGQLGALRDPDHGIYPYSTSSSTLAAFAAVGAGLPPYAITKIVAVVKAYSSCVGAGPFVSEIAGSEADELRKRGGDAGEYGVNTGRPRRMGWFDAVAARYGCMLQGATEVVLTNLDVLGYLAKVPVCTGYISDGSIIREFPASANLDRVKPVIEYLPGWLSDISAIREFDKLPREAQNYVLFVEQQIGVRITSVSIGPNREQMIGR
ncbi:adenylosuccinate synthase [Paenibacillus psychroresistens]|uniref:Adenylosuccinate synthetase n=1 Tax=Paenibacillus psychroresistens TaxID=1778678 RepID=A0A6B8RRL1_9BACL|nr:adenylosuccinate synthase [Paenibacillus psychroresistens]QGQ98026.1 adenylosuccinate synthase [Paenibacillus psychroresistens]